MPRAKQPSKARRQPTKREDGTPTSTATPPGFSVWSSPTYVPPPAQSVRAGADDHLKVQSRGYRT